MSPTPQFTLDQVSQLMNLSEAVINRLSQTLKIPARYYYAPPGHPKLMLYSAMEVDRLAQLQALLVEGLSLQEAKATVEAEPMPEDPDSPRPLHYKSPTPVVTENPDDLVNYGDDDHQMKAHLAKVTFQQYRQQNTTGAPSVFQSLAKQFASPPSRKSKAIGLSSPFSTDTKFPKSPTTQQPTGTSSGQTFSSPWRSSTSWMQPVSWTD